MQQSYSFGLVLYLLIIIFTVLFLLQIWAILRIKEMLRQVIEIFRFVKAGHMGTKHQRVLELRRAKPICENCRFRSTFVADDPQFDIYYYCQKHNTSISLEDSCQFFRFDQQNKEI